MTMEIDPSVILGLWPMAGVTTIGVTPEENELTMRAAIDAGVRAFDSAYSYGYDGESDRLLGRFTAHARDQFQIHGKVGQRWTPDHQRVIDASPRQLVTDAEASLKRIGTDHFDLLMLHSVDPEVPIEESAGAIEDLKRRGLCRFAGVCNVDVVQLDRFCSTASCAAIQCPLNLLQQDRLADLIPYCSGHGIGVHVYWTLMKGLLAGKIKHGHKFAEGDSRPKYDVFQGDKLERAFRLLDRMSEIAASTGIGIAELSIGWTLSQPGVTAAVVGARRVDQIKETAGSRPLDAKILAKLDEALQHSINAAEP